MPSAPSKIGHALESDGLYLAPSLQSIEAAGGRDGRVKYSSEYYYSFTTPIKAVERTPRETLVEIGGGIKEREYS